MALADFTLNDGQGSPVAHTFTYTATINGKVYRSDMAAAPEAPWVMIMGHQEKTIGGSMVDSHLVRFDITVLDTDGITPFANNIRICADVARKVRSDALADNMAALVRNYATSANLRLLLKGSVG